MTLMKLSSPRHCCSRVVVAASSELRLAVFYVVMILIADPHDLFLFLWMKTLAMPRMIPIVVALLHLLDDYYNPHSILSFVVFRSVR
jgi:hypothetical protein